MNDVLKEQEPPFLKLTDSAEALLQAMEGLVMILDVQGKVLDSNSSSVTEIHPLHRRWIDSGMGKDVPGNGLVGTVEHIAFPFSFKDSFGGPALISGIRINLSPALMGPADDFDFLVFLFFHQTSKTLEGFVRCLDNRNLDTVQLFWEFRIQ